MTTSVPTRTTDPGTNLTVRRGSAGRFYIVEGYKVVATFVSEEEARQELSFLQDGPDDSWASWYCDHDVPNGCDACARARAADAWYTRQAQMAEEAAADLHPRFHPYLDLTTAWGDANEMAMHAMEAWADRNRP